ncbi:hypothetical protein BGX34_007971 [Mortierella sp. NVP85]|nr:hypothetical protein BGX34_007971 [Mortierella sp. NVP85]
MKAFTLALAAVALLAVTDAAPTTAKVAAGKGQIITILNEKDFCLMLPKSPGEEIGKSEDDAVAFCTKKNLQGAPNSNDFPKNFIKSQYYTKNDKWVQMIGRFRPEKYSLSRKDGGGQYDIKAPPKSKCANYPHYVEFIEPDNGIYCLRCCKEKADCPLNKSTYGCQKVLKLTVPK